MSPLFIILVGLKMTLLNEKMLISHRCRSGLMPNLIKKSWTVSNSKYSKYKKKITFEDLELDTVQDFLIELGNKPHLHILKIIIFSLNHVIVRPTKIMNKNLKDCKIMTLNCKIMAFKVIFQQLKSTESLISFL